MTLTSDRLAAAGRLYARLEGSQTMAAPLDELRDTHPSNQEFKSVLQEAPGVTHL